MYKYGFIENIDFISFSDFSENPQNVDYIVCFPNLEESKWGSNLLPHMNLYTKTMLFRGWGGFCPAPTKYKFIAICDNYYIYKLPWKLL